MSLLTNKFTIAVFVPLILIISGTLVKKLARKKRGWSPDDWFLGLELCLATLSSTVLHLCDVSSMPPMSVPGMQAQMMSTSTFLAFTLAGLFLVTSYRQDWHGSRRAPRRRVFWLAGVCNLIGATLLFTFIILVRGIK